VGIICALLLMFTVFMGGCSRDSRASSVVTFLQGPTAKKVSAEPHCPSSESHGPRYFPI